MSNASPHSASRRDLFSFRSLLFAALFGCLATLPILWSLDVRLYDGQAGAAIVVVIVAFALLGELIRQRCRISLRLWLVAFSTLAVLLGLCSQYLLNVAKQRHGVERILAMGGKVWYDYQDDGSWFRTRGGLVLPTWLRGVGGNDLFGSVSHVRLSAVLEDQDVDVVRLGLTHIWQLDLRPCDRLSVEGLNRFAALKQLNSVMLHAEQVAALAEFGALPELERLYIDGSAVDDQTLIDAKLHRLPKLRILYLLNSQVSDAGLSYLSELDELEFVHVSSSRVTAEGIAALRRALPDCDIDIRY